GQEGRHGGLARPDATGETDGTHARTVVGEARSTVLPAVPLGFGRGRSRPALRLDTRRPPPRRPRALGPGPPEAPAGGHRVARPLAGRPQRLAAPRHHQAAELAGRPPPLP